MSSLASAETPLGPSSFEVPEASAVRTVPTVLLELIVFALLGALVVLAWGRLVVDPPPGRLAGALAICCVSAAAVALIARTAWPRRLVVAGALLAAVAGTLTAMVAVGLPVRLLAPANWSELGANVSDGLRGIENSKLPYDGEPDWTRLSLLLGAPLLLGIAAAGAFWPARNRDRARVFGLITLLATYGVAVTLDAPPSELLWGVPLLILAVTWLWLPSASLHRGGVLLTSAAVSAALALPLAAALDPEKPWWDYESWNWFTKDRTVTYDWDHSYGPLDWPQEGTPLLKVHSKQRLYWKTSVLDRFDGTGWQRADVGNPLAAAELNARAPVGDVLPLSKAHPEWVLDASFEVRNLESDFVVGAGTPLAVDGFEGAERTGDGTVLAGREALDPGEEYSIVTYSPQPSANRMRRAAVSYPKSVVAGSMLLELPNGGPSGFGAADPIRVPPWGKPRGGADRPIQLSVYGGMYELARNLTANAPTPYDAVLAIQQHLRSSYDYTQNVPGSAFPLVSFLFEDFGGYCQQFSGAMALMLRMVGIPARVVSGFAPGRAVAEGSFYDVTDKDAHSWVEVYFPRIGWVTFDPTPSTAPAATQMVEAGGLLVLRAETAAGDHGRGLVRSIEGKLKEGRRNTGPPSAGEAEGGFPAGAVVGVGFVGVGVWFGAGYARRRARLRGPRGVELQAAEFAGALGRLGRPLPAGVTLNAIERRYGRSGRNPIASYARALGRYRYEPGPSRPPGPADRRGLRRALGRGSLRRRWRALRAIPPGGPALGS